MRATIRWDAVEQQWKCDLGQGTVVYQSDPAVIEALLDYLEGGERERCNLVGSGRDELDARALARHGGQQARAGG